MTGLLPLSVTIFQRMPVCIIDARLALAPGGLLLSVRLARAMQVWLTREFWSLIDSTFVLSGKEENRRIVSELQLWHSAWLAGNLQSIFYWVGDARRESALPDNTDTDLLLRFEQLDAALLNSASPHGGSLTARLSECGRQSIALAAALAAQSPVVLTTSGIDASLRLPTLLADARNHGLDEITEIKRPKDVAILSEGLMQTPARQALAQMRLSGSALLAVHVEARNAAAITSAWADGLEISDEPERMSSICQPWEDARLYWHPLA